MSRSALIGRALGSRLRAAGAAVVAGLFVGVTAWSVDRLERAPVSVEDTGRARRVIAYEADGQHPATWKAAAGIDVLRFVAHRFAHEGKATPLRAVVTFSGNDAPMPIVIPATSRSSTVTVEASGRALSDSVAFDLDVRDKAPCEVTVVASAEDAGQPFLLMAWARLRESGEAPTPAPRLKKGRGIQLARAVGEVDWTDLDPAEKHILATRRWHRLTPVSGTSDEHGVALMVRPEAEPPALVDVQAPLLRDVMGPSRVMRANISGPAELLLDGRPMGSVSVDITSRDAPPRRLAGALPMRIPVAAAASEALEVVGEPGMTLELRSSGEGRVDVGRRIHPFAATPERPLSLGSIDAPRVVRVTARRSMRPADGDVATIAVDATLDESGSPAIDVPLRARAARSRVDRFEPPQSELIPSEPSSFLLLVPENATLTLRPTDAALALELAELDPGGAIPFVGSSPQDFGGNRHNNARFVPLEINTKPTAEGWSLRLAPPPLERAIQRLPSHGALPRPLSPATIQRDARTFVPAKAALDVHVEANALPSVVPLRLYSSTPVDVLLRVDGGTPVRRKAGLASRVTADRRVHVDGETIAFALLGDDLAPGRHTLQVVAPEGHELWVHARWERRKKARKKRVAPVKWIAGDFEP